jgi:thymidylate synthase
MITPITMLDMRGSYVDLVRQVRTLGALVRVRDEDTFELLNQTLYFPSPGGCMLPLRVGRKINQRLAAVEALSVIAGGAYRRLTLAAAPAFSDVLVSQSEADFDYAAYGPRLGETVDTVVHQLDADPSTRQAVLTVWRRDDLFHPGDKPCTLTLQFLIRHHRLHLVVNMRSNDVWLGLAYDAFVFNQLHWTVLKALQRRGRTGLTLGPYYHNAASLHLYARDVDAARGLTVTDPLFRFDRPPQGVVCPPGMFPDQAAKLLLNQPGTRPADIAEVEALNPWYATQVAALYATLDAK